MSNIITIILADASATDSEEHDIKIFLANCSGGKLSHAKEGCVDKLLVARIPTQEIKYTSSENLASKLEMK